MPRNNTTVTQTNPTPTPLEKNKSLEPQINQAKIFINSNNGEITKSLSQTISQASYFAPKPATPVIPVVPQSIPQQITPLPSSNNN